MAKIRTIKWDVRTSEDWATLSDGAKLFFIYLLMEADDEGRLLYIARQFAGLWYPLVPAIGDKEVEGWLCETESRSMTRRYTAGSRHYIHVVNFLKHQRISHPTPSRLPAPPRVVIETEVFPERDGETPEGDRLSTEESSLGIRNPEDGKGKGNGRGRGSAEGGTDSLSSSPGTGRVPRDALRQSDASASGWAKNGLESLAERAEASEVAVGKRGNANGLAPEAVRQRMAATQVQLAERSKHRSMESAEFNVWFARQFPAEAAILEASVTP